MFVSLLLNGFCFAGKFIGTFQFCLKDLEYGNRSHGWPLNWKQLGDECFQQGLLFWIRKTMILEVVSRYFLVLNRLFKVGQILPVGEMGLAKFEFTPFLTLLQSEQVSLCDTKMLDFQLKTWPTQGPRVSFRKFNSGSKMKKSWISRKERAKKNVRSLTIVTFGKSRTLPPLVHHC